MWQKMLSNSYLNVNTTGKQVWADQVATKASSEIVKHPVTVSLGHFGVNVVATVAQFSNFLGQ